MRYLFLAIVLAIALNTAAQSSGTDTIATHSNEDLAPRITRIAGSVAVNAGITEALKHSVHRMRPDGSADNSFPSRHTSWAFTVSTVLSNEFCTRTPWVGIAAQTAATAVGWQRVYDSRHHASDVAAGLAIGIASTELSYFITRAIFGQKLWPYALAETRHAPALTVYTDFFIPLSGSYGTAFGGSGTLIFPLRHGFSSGISGGTFAAACNESSHNSYKTVTGEIPLRYTFVLPVRGLSIDTDIMPGIAYVSENLARASSRWHFTSAVRASLSVQLTKATSFGFSAAYRYLNLPEAYSALTLSLSTRACF